MFIFFYACLSAITPPVAVASYAGASLSGASIWEVSLEALKASLPLYIIPWYFLIYDDLLSPTSILRLAGLTHVAQTLVGAVSLSIGAAGYIRRRLGLLERIAFLSIAVLMLIPNILVNLVGAMMFASLVVKELLQRKTPLQYV
jgi:TRAP-type uncharacterized transport system fused permease subunit